MLREKLIGLLAWLRRRCRPDKIMYIGGSDTLPPPLPRDEEAEMLRRLDEGEFAVRQVLIERNLRLVVYIARRFENTGINIEDLISIGTIGLIKAINTFGTDSDVVMRPIEADVDRQLLQTAVSRLSSRERDIITMRFGLGGVKELTQKEVADRLGISQSYISRLEKRIIARLKRELQKLA